MEFKGTKGEWSCVLGNVNQLTVIKIGKDHEIELEINDKNKIDKEIANAQLISAAPELLEVLQSLLGQLDNEHLSKFCNQYIEKSEQAINKALGL